MQIGLVVVSDVNGVVSIKKTDEQVWQQPFVAACEQDENWNNHPSEDRESVLDDGVYEYDGKVIAIIWLDDKGEYNTEEGLNIMG